MRKKYAFGALALVAWIIVAMPAWATTYEESLVDRTAEADTQFIPSWGKADIGKDRYSEYIYQWIYWKGSEEDLALLAEEGANVFFYEHGGTAYGNDTPGYWTSDLPSLRSMHRLQKTAIAASREIDPGRIYYLVTRMAGRGRTMPADLD